jgi:DNA-directed RNA polymerase specialized sigma24 family protein
MNTFCHPYETVTSEQARDNSWSLLYTRLLPIVNHWVYNAHLNSWYGQESDVAWDIVLFAVGRTFEYSLKARYDGVAIISLERLSIRIARNHFLDRVRKESRLTRFDQGDCLAAGQIKLDNLVDPAELAFDTVYTSWLFTKIAHVVAGFPAATRDALLIDLANRMSFEDGQPTALQRAFLDVGIRLQDYQGLLPNDPVAKSRHASLLTLAYKRLVQVLCLRQNDLAA